jgi:hypothetical protein
MQKKTLVLLVFALAFAQMHNMPFKLPSIADLNFTISGNSIWITLPNGTTKSIPLTIVKEIVQNISTNQAFLNISIQQLRLNKEIEKIKEVYKHYGGNEAVIDKELQEEVIKNISIPQNASYEEIARKIIEREREAWEKVERKFINASAHEEWKRHKVCIAIYPNIKECIPRVFPVFINQTTKIMLPNGSIITLNRTISIKGLGELKLRNITNNETEIEIENETSHSFVREIRNRPVIVTIVKTKNETHVMVTNLISGVKNEIDVKKEEGVFKHFVIHTKENVSNVVLNITRIKNLTLPQGVPSNVNKILSKALIYRIKANVSDLKLANVTMNLTLNQSWLNQVNTTIDKIIVIRVSENGSTMLLPILNITSEKIGNETFYHLIIASPGFSYYAVIPILSINLQQQISSMLLIVAIVVFLILLAFIYFFKKRKSKS